MQTITTKKIREDLQGFLQKIQQGEQFTVLYRSRPLVQIGKISTQEQGHDQNIPGSPEAIKHSLLIAETLRNRSNNILDQKKSSKELYSELLDEQYGIS